MSDSNTDIIKKIEDIERQLRQLRIELGKRKLFKKEVPCEVGEEVIILNPKIGQGKEGKLIKVNPTTKYVTVETVNSKGKREKVVRSSGNIQRKAPKNEC